MYPHRLFPIGHEVVSRDLCDLEVDPGLLTGSAESGGAGGGVDATGVADHTNA